MEEVEDVKGVVKVYKDGSIFRLDVPDLFVQPSPEGLKGDDHGVASKDVVINAELGLWVRLYLPPPPTTGARMPVIVYFHGGGFCLASPAMPDFHNFSIKLAAAVGAIIISVNYRLAPEHRLPAAYDDCLEAVEWLKAQSQSQSQAEGGGLKRETWLHSYAEFSRAYLLGDSAGANIAHQVVLRGGMDRKPMLIRGVVLLQPFFGGEDRKLSEIECPCDAFLNLDGSDRYWRLSLPVGSNRDHPFSKPLGPGSPSLKDGRFPPLLIAVGGRDIMRDRAFEYCTALKECGKQVEVVAFEEEDHGFYARRPHSESTQHLLHHISGFVATFS